MTRTDAHIRLDTLITSTGGDGPQMIGIISVGRDGSICVSMDSDDDIDILRMGISGMRKAGGVTIDKEMDTVVPTLEEVS